MNFIYLPMAIISGTFFTPKDYPVFLRDREVLPLTYFTKLTRDVMVRDSLWSEPRRSRSSSSGGDRPRRGPARSAGNRARLRARALDASSVRRLMTATESRPWPPTVRGDP